MKRGFRCAALLLLLTLMLAWPMPAAGDDGRPTRLHAHPDRDLSGDSGPWWVAASVAFKSDGTVQEGWRIGERRARGLVFNLASRVDAEGFNLADCWVTPERAAGRRNAMSMPGRTVFLPGDFLGWVAASEAVVVGTVADLVPGFDANGRANTIIVLSDVSHLYPSSEYSYDVKYVILPYARFVAGGLVYCSPLFISLEYYPTIGDRLLIAAGRPADNESLAMTVQGMSRVVQVKDDDTLVTYGGSDFDPVSFSADFPETLNEARTRAWEVWESGLVDFEDSLGLEEFTQRWRRMQGRRRALENKGCTLSSVQLRDVAVGMRFTSRCSAEGAEDMNLKGSGHE